MALCTALPTKASRWNPPTLVFRSSRGRWSSTIKWGCIMMYPPKKDWKMPAISRMRQKITSFSRNSMLKLSVTKHLLGLSEKLRHLLPHFDHATEAAEVYPVSDRFGVSTRSCPPKRKLHWKPCALPWWLPAWTLHLGGLGDQLWPFWWRNDLRWDDTKNQEPHSLGNFPCAGGWFGDIAWLAFSG